MSAWRPGTRNLLSDVAGVRVGHAGDERLKSGTTVVILDTPSIASVAILGGAPGTRETDLLAPENTVAEVDSLVLSGGSAFGLDAASGVQAWLAENGRGFAVGDVRVPIVPAAILFDLANGGAKAWGRYPPYREFGYDAARSAKADFAIGTVGAGIGCTTATVKGGIGSASTVLSNGITVAALVAVNAVGSATIGAGRSFWAAPFELGDEFGGLGLPQPFPPGATAPRTKLDARMGANTTIGIIATDAVLDKAAAKRLAIAGQDGYAKAIWPSHTDFDGDLVFALATGGSGILPEPIGRVELAAAAAATMARAVARAIYTAVSAEGDRQATWSILRDPRMASGRAGSERTAP
ncbi:P1 family peptidase [Aurantimonas sp. C2-6-R+9]|uniref:P1 family peptidase n=1 Tax=unclassified Aurantimonas TaxID=2638230 RepID=UPI002E1844B6|nr:MULTISPECIES: P1 family peptidase [unclassified Aurantimonas]MEC5291745.1 P1 family peptidase [Aurantimonas sp. C2-3-R2]MEC5381898.1 P1 family peptidase [Aurantimonas sp. C2-6-R+9]MEC5412801.1 P1 family peptidase [Aurantimonas sp. C2-4-R8]